MDVPRETALKIIYEITEAGAYSNLALDKRLDDPRLNATDRAFITELVYGTVRWRLTIDWIIGQFSTVRSNRVSPWILAVLRLGIYQLLFTDRVPAPAACNESVKLAKRYGHEASSRFVNGVLRNIERNRDKIVYPDRKTGSVRYLSVRYSYPEWLVEKWLGLFGEEFTEGLLAAGNETPDFTVRVNVLRISREQLIEELKREGFDAGEGRYARDAVVIRNAGPVLKTEAYGKGLFQVQDESSMLVGYVLDPKPGEFIVDACSAPGGKTAHIAQMMGNKGTVLARDIHDHRIGLVREACSRLGLGIVKTERFDAAVTDENLAERADRVLLDAPCTGLGIIRRKPDIKWARNPGDAAEMAAVQAKMLDAVSKYVKPGGVLVYSTCTINPEENEKTVEAFLERNSAFELEDIRGLLPEKLEMSENLEKNGMCLKTGACPATGMHRGIVRLYPSIHGIDGFFIARMKKGVRG